MTLETADIRLIQAETFHGRHGAIKNAFRYRFDALMVPVSRLAKSPSRWLTIDRPGLISFFAKDHGDGGDLLKYARRLAKKYGFSDICDGQINLIAQPRFLGYGFNPVSFWTFQDGCGGLRVVIAEVSNTFGERHSYLCHHDDFSVIFPKDRIEARKMFHVSPFQDVAGHYSFRFRINDGYVGVWIDHRNQNEGVFASMTGNISPLSSGALLRNAVLKPFGALRVMALIHWQALKLKLKGGRYRRLPVQNPQRISR